MKAAVRALLLLSPLTLCFCSSDPPGTPGKLDPKDLAAPPSGQGWQLKTPEMAVNPGEEVQACYFYKVRDLAAAAGLPADQPVNLHRIQIAQRDGSHHMNIFRVKTVKGLDPAKGTLVDKNGQGECFKSPNWADWPLVANTQRDGEVDWTYPDGVANEFGPDEWLMLQSHFVNASTQKTPDGYGAVAVNFWTIPKDQVKYQLGTLFATRQNIRICQKNPRPQFETGCQIKSEQPVHVIGANGHFHSRGTEFKMYTWDGVSTSTPPDSARFYESKEWDEPPMLRSPELDKTIPANGGVWYTCAYEWKQPDPAIGCQGLNDYDKNVKGTPDANLDCCYTFGPVVEKNEHCNAFVYYYPKVDNITCN